MGIWEKTVGEIAETRGPETTLLEAIRDDNPDLLTVNEAIEYFNKPKSLIANYAAPSGRLPSLKKGSTVYLSKQVTELYFKGKENKQKAYDLFDELYGLNNPQNAAIVERLGL